MFQCRACGGALRFDPASQKMLCAYCDSSFEPEEITDSGNAEESDLYNAVIYTCPQCGGELGSVETSAVEFCSFCGATTVLESRLSKMKKPTYIIPFRKSKEDCRQSLKHTLDRAFFVPNSFKKAEVERFRGIYMPYWSYNVSQGGKATFRIEEEKGDYLEKYSVSAKVDAEYEGISHDASSGFADRISESIEPYHYKDRKSFTPSYLAGFYSDIQDVDPGKYVEDAQKFANDHTYNEFMPKVNVGGGSIREETAKTMNSIFNTEITSVDSTLVPVWFLSYRKNNRVAYAAVNGETGKVYSDMPIDIKKIWAMALVLAIPLFFVFNMFLSMRAMTLTVSSMVMMLIAEIIYMAEWSILATREEGTNASFEKASKRASKEGKPKRGIPRISLSTIGCAIPMTFIALGVCSVLISMFLDVAPIAMKYVIGIGIIAIPALGIYMIKLEKNPILPGKKAYILCMILSIISALIYSEEPASDVIFYVATIGNLLAILYTLSTIWKTRNLLATRPLPQFEKRGGEMYEK